MFDKKNVKTVIIILLLFSIGLVFFYIFSAPYGDGLEKTMEATGVQEAEPFYHAPLNYGENYPSTLLMGFLGFLAALFIVFLCAKLLRKKNDANQH